MGMLVVARADRAAIVGTRVTRFRLVHNVIAGMLRDSIGEDLCDATHSDDLTGGFLVARGKIWLYTGIRPAMMLARIVNPVFTGLAMRKAKARIVLK